MPSVGECGFIEGMPRRLRLQYPGAIYHLMARGNGRQDIVCDDADRERLKEQLGKAAMRCSWRVYTFVIMSNHLHVVLKTPEPNLSRGMQSFLSAYANGWSRRHRFSGHVFQGRYRTELVEDETYLWTVTRYVHLNPVRAGIRPRSKFILAIRRRVWFYRGHAPTLTPPVPWRDLPPDGPRQRPSGHRMR